jgi:hypothetical protein
MGGCCGKKDKKKDGEAEGDGKCVISPNTMKLVTLITLLCSDFDVVLSLASIVSYTMAGGIFYLFIIVIAFFFVIYMGGCKVAARESSLFLERFKDKVRLNEISGVSMEDLDDALAGRRIFWMGPEYEAAKKRKANVEALKLLTPDSAGPDEIEIDSLAIALREAEMVGTAQLRMPGNPKFGERVVKRATEKLVQAKKVRETGGKLPRRASSRIADQADDIPGSDPNYKPNKPKTRDQMEGRSDQSGKVDTDGLGDDNDEEDFTAKMFAEEISAAEAADDANLVKMLQLASIKQLDSYKVDKKLLDKKGNITDPIRALYMICEAKGILHSYHQASRTFSRRIVKWSHSIPYYRLMEYGWQPSVSHTDFAGILNANGLYSFTVGIPQFIFAIVFVVSTSGPSARDPAPCETDPSSQCSLMDDFRRPNVQQVIVYASFTIGLISLIISLTNIMVDFPAQLFDIAEKDEEALHFTLQAEHATKTWEDKLQVEVQENVKKMLKLSTQFENNSIPGMEAPGLVIEDVMKLERRAMEKKVAYIEHFLTMSEDEKKIRSDLREGKRKKKSSGSDKDEELVEEEAVGRQQLPQTARQPAAPALPPPKQPSLQPTPEPTAAASRIPSRIPSVAGVDERAAESSEADAPQSLADEDSAAP